MSQQKICIANRIHIDASGHSIAERAEKVLLKIDGLSKLRIAEDRGEEVEFHYEWNDANPKIDNIEDQLGSVNLTRTDWATPPGATIAAKPAQANGNGER